MLLLPLALTACSQSGDSSSAPDSSSTVSSATATDSANEMDATAKASQANAGQTATGNDSPTSTLKPADTEAAQAAYTTEQLRVAPQGAELVIQDVRAGTHDGYDRVVFEFSGTGRPGYVAGYTTEPRQQASGHPIDVNGNAYFELMIQGTPMEEMSPREELIRVGPVTGVATGNVKQVVHGGVFEADTQYIIGVDQTRPYTVTLLENPTRVVVDFQR